MKFYSSKWRIAAVAALVLLLLFLLRPGASRLKSRIILSISAAVGRPVDIGSVHVRLLPRPGFDLENLVVYDDAAFGAEPMLRAAEVTASLRLTSLLRGHMEIARLDLTEPSLNLVHGLNGRWNLEMLLERSAHMPLAPTAKAKTEPRPAFPYIEASSARINFKNGPEKKPYALTNADFALWQDSENVWGVRLKAQPVRADLNLNDTGQLQISGTWQRADALRDTPLQISLEWDRAQLGQLTKFFTGNDQGWRGGVKLDVTLTGTPADLKIVSRTSVEDFRRYDIASGQPLRLAADCLGEYKSGDRTIHSVLCSSPAGSGMVMLKGELSPPGAFSLSLTLSDVPAAAVVALAQRAKKNLPEDLVTTGAVRGNFSLQRTAGVFNLAGRGEVSDFRLASTAEKAEFGPKTLPFVLATGSSPDTTPRNLPRKNVASMHIPDAAHLEFGSTPSGHAAGPLVRGWAAREGYHIAIDGEVEIARALRMMRLFGIPALQSAAEGTAQVDLQIAGTWAGQTLGSSAGFRGPQVTGTARLQNVKFAVRGTGGPVEVASADLTLAPGSVRVEKINASAADTSWSGSLEFARGCGSPATCPVQFNLATNQLVLAGLTEWINPRAKDKPWYRMLQSSSPSGAPFLGSVRASGRITAARLDLQNTAATHVSANVNLQAGKLQITDLTADLFGGKHHGQWLANFNEKQALCHGSGSLTAISLAQISGAMNDHWVAGTANATYELEGECPAQFWATAEGTMQFDVRDGVLPHVSLTGDTGSLKIARFTGHATLLASKVELKDASLESSSGKFQVTGTASLRREINLKLGAATAYAITGTLAEPKIVQITATQTARLKP